MQIVDENVKTLPLLSDIVYELISFKNSENIDIEKLFRIIEKDSILTTKILKMANSDFFGFNNSIETLSNALSLYGVNFAIDVAIAESIKTSIKFDLESYGIDASEFQRVQDISCFILLEWLEDEIELKEELTFSLLVGDLGKFLISDFLKKHKKNEQFLFELEEKELIPHLEKRFVGITSSGLSALMLDKWGIENSIVKKVFHIDDEKEIYEDKGVAVLNIIKTICNIKEPLVKENIEIAIEKAKSNELNTKKLLKVIEEVVIRDRG